MKSLSVIFAGLQLAAAVAIPADASTDAVDNSAGPELSGLWDRLYAVKPQAQEEGVPEGVFLETAIDKSKAATPGGKVTTIKYGPYSMGPMSALENRMSAFLEKPCSNCYIVAMQSNLLDKDQKQVNIDKGGWLHHMVMFNTGIGKKDAVCPTSAWPQRIFASGNERTPVRTNSKYKYGIQFSTGDSLSMLYDLMNESDQKATYYIEMTYEWVPMSQSGYQPIKMAWLDITGCGLSETRAKSGTYEMKSPGWKATYAGRLLSATGHTHDGGADVVIYQNGKPVCSSLQIYGRKPAWIGEMNDRKMKGMKIAHISDTGSCVDFGEVKVGDNLQIGAKYNTTAHPLNKNMNGLGDASIMGISQVYIG